MGFGFKVFFICCCLFSNIEEWLRKQDFDAVVVTRGKCVTQSDQTKDKTKLFTFHGLKRELGPKAAKAHLKLAQERGRAGPVRVEDYADFVFTRKYEVFLAFYISSACFIRLRVYLGALGV